MLARAAAAAAAAITAVLLQMTFVGPLSPVVPASLPAALVAAVAIVGGAGPGLAMGFSVGLLADLASAHHVGILAATWLLLGLGVGRYADPRRSRRSQVLIGALGAAIAGVVGQIVVVASSGGVASIAAAPWRGVQALIIDALLLAAILPAARAVMGRLTPPRLGIQRV